MKSVQLLIILKMSQVMTKQHIFKLLLMVAMIFLVFLSAANQLRLIFVEFYFMIYQLNIF